MNHSAAAELTPGSISARIDRLPATRTMWTMLVLLSFGMVFELYDLLFTADVAPSLVKSGVLTAKTGVLTARQAFAFRARSIPSPTSFRASSASPQRMILTHLPGSRSL
jgi:hypothetical protein